MRRISIDPNSSGKGGKEGLRRRVTLPSNGNVMPQMNNEAKIPDSINANSITTINNGTSDLIDASTGPPATMNLSNPPDNAEADLLRTKAAMASLQRKIQHTFEQMKMEQNVQSENVNEYLESMKTEKPNLQHMRSAFEKKNQKSTQTIMQLQAKLELYQKRLSELEQHGSTGSKDVLRNVSQGFKTMVSKPIGFATMIKNKLGSVDNVSSEKAHDDQNSPVNTESDRMLQMKGISSPVTRHSTDNDVSSIVGEAPTSRIFDIGKQPRSNSLHSGPKALPPSVPEWTAPRSLYEIQAENNQLRNSIAAIKLQIHREFNELKQTLELERDFCDRLGEQLNDLMELHQNEMADIKQEMTSLEEKIQYTLDERTRDLQELLENCLHRVSKVEHQQHQQFIQSESLEKSGFSIAKVVNFILAFLSFCLVVLSTAATLLSPFLSTRLRYFLTFCFVTLGIIGWRNWETISPVFDWFIEAHLKPWFSNFQQGKDDLKDNDKSH